MITPHQRFHSVASLAKRNIFRPVTPGLVKAKTILKQYCLYKDCHSVVDPVLNPALAGLMPEVKRLSRPVGKESPLVLTKLLPEILLCDISGYTNLLSVPTNRDSKAPKPTVGQRCSHKNCHSEGTEESPLILISRRTLPNGTEILHPDTSGLRMTARMFEKRNPSVM